MEKIEIALQGCSDADRNTADGRVGQLVVDIYVASVHEMGQWISCALVCPQLHAWTYIEQINPPSPQGTSQPAWADELRKIPRARFARGSAELLELARSTVAEFAERASQARGADVRAVLRFNADEQMACALGLPSQLVRTGAVPDGDFWAKCGGREANRAHALLAAMALAACDAEVRQPLLVDDISRMELLLGTKNAQSMRAWLRQRAAPKKKDAKGRRGDQTALGATAV